MKDIKALVRGFLAERNRDAVVDLLLQDRRVVPALNRLLFDADPLIQWRAVEGLGWVAATDPFYLEKIIGRLFYTMNDDSGQVGWMTPYALGEICYNDPDLVEDFFNIVISAMDNEVFEAGAVWAVGRVAMRRPDLVEEQGPALRQRLFHPNPLVRGLAAQAAARLGHGDAREKLRLLTRDQAVISIYEDGQLIETTVGRLAARALTDLNPD
ncbi:MAG: PBS lyase [Pseudomonadota bacterium]